MKNSWLILAAILAFLPDRVSAADPNDLRLGGVPDLIYSKLKESKFAALTTFRGRPGAALYVPIRTWQTAAGTPIMELPAFGYYGALEHKPGRFATATLNLPGLSARLFNSEWFKTHIKKSVFPPIFFGPAAILPTDLRIIEKLRWDDWSKYAAVLVSVRLQK